MNYYFGCLGTPNEFQIQSVTTVDKTKGFIYIEAYASKHAYFAIADIGGVHQKLTLVDF